MNDLTHFSRSPAPGRLLSVHEVMKQTSLARATIYRMQRAGTFPHSQPITVGRVAWREADVERWKADPMGWRPEADS